MRGLYVILNALVLLGAVEGCSQMDHGSSGGGCNCGGGSMVSGPQMTGDGTMMISSGASTRGGMMSSATQPADFMGQASKMPQPAHPVLNDEPPTE